MSQGAHSRCPHHKNKLHLIPVIRYLNLYVFVDPLSKKPIMTVLKNDGRHAERAPSSC